MSRNTHSQRGRFFARGSRLFALSVAILLTAAFLAGSWQLRAQEPTTELTESFVGARPVKTTPPIYPAPARMRGQEGWVILSFIVSETGEIVEPMVEDSSGVEAFETAALETVGKWEWNPATLNGEPVSQSMVRYQITFALESSPRGVRRTFRRRYQEIADLIEQGSLSEAESLLTDLRYEGRHNLDEDSWFWLLDARYMDAVEGGDEREIIKSLKRAVYVREIRLTEETLLLAIARLYALQIESRDYSGALTTFGWLTYFAKSEGGEGYEDLLERMHPTYEQIVALIAGDSVLRTEGEIGTNGYWVYDLLRRSFSIADLSGDIQHVDIRCERGNQIYSFTSEDDNWNIPDSWGDCGVYVKGTTGTTFGLLQYPSPD